MSQTPQRGPLIQSVRELLWPNVSVPTGLRRARTWATISAAWLALLGLFSIEYALGPNREGLAYYAITLLGLVLFFVLSRAMARARSVVATSVGLLILGVFLVKALGKLQGNLGLIPFALTLLAFLGATNGLRGAIATARQITTEARDDTTVTGRPEPPVSKVQTSRSIWSALPSFWRWAVKGFTTTGADLLFIGWWIILAVASAFSFFERIGSRFPNLAAVIDTHTFPGFSDDLSVSGGLAAVLGVLLGLLYLIGGLVSLIAGAILAGSRRGLFPERLAKAARSIQSFVHDPAAALTDSHSPQEVNDVSN